MASMSIHPNDRVPSQFDGNVSLLSCLVLSCLYPVFLVVASRLDNLCQEHKPLVLFCSSFRVGNTKPLIFIR